MKWVSGIAWTGQNYVVETVNKDGVTGTIPVEGLAELQYESQDTRNIGITTDFSSWRTVRPTEYLAALGFPAETKNAQEVYEFEAGGKVYLISAAVLMNEIFLPLKGTAPYLFRPHGIENIITANGNGLSIKFIHNIKKEIRGCRTNRDIGRLNLLSWMYCYPSARNMWDSILTSARKGYISLRLPSGKLSVNCESFEHNKKWIVTNININTIYTQEKPFDFVEKSTEIIKCNYRTAAAKKIEILPIRGDNWSISDEEWDAISTIVATKWKTKYSIRAMLDCILLKFGQGISWHKLDCGEMNRTAIISYYNRLRNDGRWDKMLIMLQKIRTILPAA